MTELNLALRFLLELAGAVAVGYWGFQATDSPLRFVLAVGLPIALVVVWGLFIAPRANSPLPPDVRVVVGSGLLLVAAGALYLAGQPTPALVLAGLIVVNTILMFALPESR